MSDIIEDTSSAHEKALLLDRISKLKPRFKRRGLKVKSRIVTIPDPQRESNEVFNYRAFINVVNGKFYVDNHSNFDPEHAVEVFANGKSVPLGRLQLIWEYV